MNHLTRHDYAAALQLLGRIEALADDVDAFARAAVVALSAYVACESTTLSVVAVNTQGAERPPLCTDPAHCIDLAHAIAVPLVQDADNLVAIVLNRGKQAFGERDRERLELLRPHLAFLYGHACRAAARAASGATVQPQAPALPEAVPHGELTHREREVLQWLACGKTDAEIAALLSISPRTVHKHLEHIYVKLGVETRTAAVMRMLNDGHARGTDAVHAFTAG